MHNMSQNKEYVDIGQISTYGIITQEEVPIKNKQSPLFKISLCKDKFDHTPVNTELNFEELKALLINFPEEIISKSNAPAFVGGYYDGDGRKDENLLGVCCAFKVLRSVILANKLMAL
jgi:hypothetical protein